MNRGSSTAVGCIHRAPFVAGSYTVSYVVGVLVLNRLYRSMPDVRSRLAEPQDLREAHVHDVDAVAVHRTRQHEVHVLRGQPGRQRPSRCGQELRGVHAIGCRPRRAVGAHGRAAGLRIGLRAEDGADEDVHLGHGVGGEPANAGQPGLRDVAARSHRQRCPRR